MADLRTPYLGLELCSPLVASASPLSRSVETVKQLEEVGIGAVVLYSLFEEQIREKEAEFRFFRTRGLESPPETLRYAPSAESFSTDPDSYLRHFEATQEAVSIPIIPSLNGATLGGWTRYARLLEKAGAPALELNLYLVASELAVPGAEIEARVLEIVTAVRQSVSIPLAVKLSPYFSSLGHLGSQLEEAGADALVLFNRFFQPDVDIETHAPIAQILLSTAADLRLTLRWIALLSGRLRIDMAASGGVLNSADALKVILAGANVAMLCSLLLTQGMDQVPRLIRGVSRWLEDHGHEGLGAIRGTMSQPYCSDPQAFDRGQYIRTVLGGPASPNGGRETSWSRGSQPER